MIQIQGFMSCLGITQHHQSPAMDDRFILGQAGNLKCDLFLTLNGQVDGDIQWVRYDNRLHPDHLFHLH